MKRFLLLALLGIAVLAWLRGRAAVEWRPAPVEPASTVVPVQYILVPEAERRVEDGLPVPIYPGTRVSEAEIETPRPSVDRQTPKAPRTLPPLKRQRALPVPPATQAVTSLLSASEERARANARKQLDREVAQWLAPDVPFHQWSPPAEWLDRLVVRTHVTPVLKESMKEFGPLFEATLDVDFSPPRRAELLALYHHDLVLRRLGLLGGGLGFTLACLAALAGYIRADEATKGYYTNWLRMAAAAGVGASGVVVYKLLA